MLSGQALPKPLEFNLDVFRTLGPISRIYRYRAALVDRVHVTTPTSSCDHPQGSRISMHFMELDERTFAPPPIFRA